MTYLVIALAFLALILVPLLALGILLVIKLFHPEIGARGIKQLTAVWTLPKDRRRWRASNQQRRELEDEVIRRFGAHRANDVSPPESAPNQDP